MTSQTESIGRYHIIREISHSEIAVVYLAQDPRLDREVAIKLVLPGRELSEEFQKNFRKASKDLAQLSHANIIKVLDFGEQDGSPFIVMEYLRGGSLADRIGQPVSWQEAVRLITPIAHALEYAHAENLVHRDLKPSNILFTDENQPAITDLNFVSLVEDEETRDFTSTTVGLGKPEYMSPEQGKGLNVDHRADIYSLGIIFYELITGKKPFESDNPMEVVIRQVTTPPPDPRKIVPDLPTGLVQIMMKALSKDPEQRYASMGAFAKDLENYLRKKGGSTHDQPTRLPKLMITAGVVIILLIVIGWFGWKQFGKSNISPLPAATTEIAISDRIATPTAEIETVMSNALPTDTPSVPQNPTTSTKESSISNPFPLLPGKSLPIPATSLKPENIVSMVELARWGSPKFTEIVWTPDSDQMVASTSNGVYFIAADDLRMLRFVDLQAWMTAVDVSSDGKFVAAGDDKGQIRLLDFSSGETLFTLQGHSAEITSLAFSPDSSLLLSGSKDNTAILWRTENGALAYTLKDHLLSVNAVNFSIDGQIAITGSDDFRINLWDTNTGSKIKTITGNSQVNQLAISHDRRTLAAALRNSTVQFWNLNEDKSGITLLDRTLVLAVNTVSFSPNGQLIISGAADSTIRLWQASTGDEMWETSGAKDPEHIDKTSDAILSLAFSPDGSRFFSVTRGGYLAIWNLGTQSIVKSQRYLWQQITRLVFSPQTKYLAVQVAEDHVEIWNVTDGSMELLINGVLARGNPFSEKGDQIAILSAKDKISIYDLASHNKTMVLQGYSPGATVSFLPGGKFIGASTDRKVTLWSLNSGQELDFADSNFIGKCQEIYALDGSLLTAGSKIGLMQSPDAINGFCSVGRSSTVLDEDYLPSGDIIALATNNQKAILWEHLATDSAQISFSGHIGKVYGVGLTPDGKLMVTAGEDYKVLLWNPAGPEEPLRVLENHYGPVLDAVFSADGKYLATSSTDGAVQIWGIYP